MRLLTVLLLAFAILSSPGMARAAERTVLVIPKGLRAHFWKRIHDGAIQAGNERDVEILFRGPHGSDDNAGQLYIIQSGIDERVDAIVIAPNHESKASELLRRATALGIKVILIDSDMQFKDRVSFVGSDNERAGRDAANFLISQIKPGSRVLLLRYLRNNPSTHRREKGFLDTAAATQPPCTVVQSDYAGVSIGEAYEQARAALLEHPEISAIFSPGEATTIGALRAVDDLEKDHKLRQPVVIVGFDYTDDIRRSLQDGTLRGTMVQTPFNIGYLGVMAACDAIEGKPVKKRIVTKTWLVTKPSELPDGR